MEDLLPINLLSAGQIGRVRHVAGCADTVHRLAELGMRTGAELEIVQCGSPCIVRLGGGKLCFRETDALNVFVQLEAAL